MIVVNQSSFSVMEVKSVLEDVLTEAKEAQELLIEREKKNGGSFVEKQYRLNKAEHSVKRISKTFDMFCEENMHVPHHTFGIHSCVSIKMTMCEGYLQEIKKLLKIA